MIGGLAWLRQTPQALPILFGKESNLFIADNRQHDNAPRLACKKYVPRFLFFLLAIGVKFGFILINERFGTSCDLIGPSCFLIPICWLFAPLSTWYKWPCLRNKPALLTKAEAALVLLANLRPLALFSRILKKKAFLRLVAGWWECTTISVAVVRYLHQARSGWAFFSAPA